MPELATWCSSTQGLMRLRRDSNRSRAISRIKRRYQAVNDAVDVLWHPCNPQHCPSFAAQVMHLTRHSSSLDHDNFGPAFAELFLQFQLGGVNWAEGDLAATGVVIAQHRIVSAEIDGQNTIGGRGRNRGRHGQLRRCAGDFGVWKLSGYRRSRGSLRGLSRRRRRPERNIRRLATNRCYSSTCRACDSVHGEGTQPER